MYERFYNLRERPFALSPDPEYLYLSRVHSEALDSIRYGIESRAGFIVVTGEIGAGKTTLLQTLLQRLDSRTVVARIVNTMLEPRELLEAIALDFGLNDTSKSKPALLRDLGNFLVQQRAEGRRPLLVIDEAQNLSAQALEEVRLLSNLETEKSKLLQILLAGQPNLRDKIASPELEQFRQRVAVSYHLVPLDGEETVAYINFRLEHAALGEPPRFSPEAADLIYQVSGGVPRIINVVCDATLVFGYAEERRALDGALLEEVIRELEATGIIPPQEYRQRTARAIAAAPARVPPPPAPAPVTIAPAPARLSPVLAAAAPRPVLADAERERSLASAREALPAARQLAAAREAELAAQRELVNRRQAELAAKEEALLQRERQMAEQRRIMGEEYRLLRNAQPGRPVAGGRIAAGTPGSVAGRAPTMTIGQPAARRPASGATPPQVVPLWQRIVRLFTGAHALRS
jgi:putative secretion ATPase (PEP-CTERM system associated)